MKIKLKSLQFMLSSILKPSFFIILSCSAFLSGCGEGKYVGKGKEIIVDDSCSVYLDSGNSKYIQIKDCQLLSEGYQWDIPTRMKLIDGSVTTSCGDVKWSVNYGDHTTDYTAKGMIIKAKGRIKIEDDCPEGTYLVSVKLPYLSKYCEMTNTTLTTIMNDSTPIFFISNHNVEPAPTIETYFGKVHTIPIQHYQVKESNLKAWLWTIGVTIALVLGVFILFALAE